LDVPRRVFPKVRLWKVPVFLEAFHGGCIGNIINIVLRILRQ
jgi:hypothetical protein